MNPEARRFVTGAGLWLQSAVPYEDSGKSFVGVASDYYGTSDAHGGLPAPDPTGTTSAADEALANTAYARAPLAEDAIGRWGGDLDFEVDSDHGVTAVSEPELPLHDVPLIAEGLLREARQLTDSGAPTEAVKAILDHVAALREGRF